MNSKAIALSESDRQLLYYLQFVDDAPLSTLAHKLKIKESTLRSKVSRWYRDGLVSHRAIVNLFRVGATGLEIFFTPSREIKGVQKKIIKTVSESEGVRWFARTTGRFDFHVGIHAMNLLEITRHLAEIEEKAPGGLSNWEAWTSLGYWWFGRKYLAPGGTTHTKRLEAPPVTELITIDETDHRILRLLGREPLQSLRTIALILDLPQSTVGYRIQSMRKNGIIVGFPHLASTRQLGMQTFRVMINLKMISAATHELILQWCQGHPSIVSMVRMLGAWDYILRCEVSAPEEIFQVTDLLQEEFGKVMQDWSVVSVLQDLSLNFYPIQKLK